MPYQINKTRNEPCDEVNSIKKLPISASIALDGEIPKKFIVFCCFITFDLKIYTN